MYFPIPRLNEILDLSKGILSIWGDFGNGKTTFVLQTAINAVKVGKKILYFYSKPNFPYEKIMNIIQEDYLKGQSDILDNITIVEITDFKDLYKIVLNLEFLILNYLKEKEDSIALIIIDSITDLYRLELNKEKKKKNVFLNYQLNQIMATLNFLNNTYKIDVLVVNELSRKNQDGQTIEVESGGRVMQYWTLYSVKIARTEILSERKFILTKHPQFKNLEFKLNLTKKGFIEYLKYKIK